MLENSLIFLLYISCFLANARILVIMVSKYANMDFFYVREQTVFTLHVPTYYIWTVPGTYLI